MAGGHYAQDSLRRLMMKKQRLIVWGMVVLAIVYGLLLAGCGSAQARERRGV
jgi:hypothetical protein